MTIHDHEILAWVGGTALERFGTLTRRTQVPRFGGEELQEAFTRSSSATAIDRDGKVRRVAVSVPGVEFVDVDGDTVRESATILLEGSVTNRLLWSEEFNNAAWIKTRSAITADQHAAPDAATTADRLVEDATASSTHFIHQTVTVAANVNYTVSVFVKDVGGGRSWLRLQVGDAGGANRALAFFNAATGALGTTAAAGTGAVVRALVTPMGNAWFRVTLVGSVGSGVTSILPQINLADADNSVTYTGDGVSYLALWGATLRENVGFPANYVATTTAATTRSADLFSIPFHYHPAGISVYADFHERMTTPWASSRIIQIGKSDNTAPRFGLERPASGTTYQIFHDNNTGGTVTQTVSLTPAFNDRIELGGRLLDTGAVSLAGAKNGGGVTQSAASAGHTLATAWSDILVFLNSVGATAVGYTAFRSLIIVRGSHTIPEFRDLVGQT